MHTEMHATSGRPGSCAESHTKSRSPRLRTGSGPRPAHGQRLHEPGSSINTLPSARPGLQLARQTCDEHTEQCKRTCNHGEYDECLSPCTTAGQGNPQAPRRKDVTNENKTCTQQARACTSQRPRCQCEPRRHQELAEPRSVPGQAGAGRQKTPLPLRPAHRGRCCRSPAWPAGTKHTKHDERSDRNVHAAHSHPNGMASVTTNPRGTHDHAIARNTPHES